MRILNYIKDTKSEMAHVTWLSKKQAIIFTVVVIVFSIITSIYLGLFDMLFTFILEKFL